MPSLFSIGRYIFFFWSAEHNEPIHVHVSVNKISPHSTKIWLTKDGNAALANNISQVPQHDLNKILKVVRDSHADICEAWKEFFNTETIKFYC